MDAGRALSGRRPAGNPGSASSGRGGCSAHPGSRVVRNGTAATASGRRQKFFCQTDDGRHTFTAPISDDGGGPRPAPPPWGHRYGADVITRGLIAVARGATYRQARIAVLGGSPAADAKLISRWVDSFGPLIRRELSAAGVAPRIAARAVPVGRSAVGRRWLLSVVDGTGRPHRPRVWPVRLVPAPDEDAWHELFRGCAGRPELVLCQSQAQETAARACWGPPWARLADPAGGVILDFGPADGPETARGADLTSARMSSSSADRSLRRLVSRAASIRSADRADLIVGLMALEISGLATADAVASIIDAALRGRGRRQCAWGSAPPGTAWSLARTVTRARSSGQAASPTATTISTGSVPHWLNRSPETA